MLLQTPSTTFFVNTSRTLTDEIENFVIGQLAMKAVFEQMDTQFWESMEFIGALCGANTSTEIMMGALDRKN